MIGNDESPMNYTDNTYHFRQDSTFLYYFGIQRPGLAAVIDADNDLEVVFGDEYTVEDYVWRGPQPTIAGLAEKCGVYNVQPAKNLAVMLAASQQRKQTIHFLPLYRPENKIKLYELLGIAPKDVPGNSSVDLVKSSCQPARD
ncbi:MAG: aminopeptidase P N-terminal domain-containing protein [Marinilabiliales bacterium]|nr:aminopeptidase P N-terminal domain-containing protein [Marinilabiliales bacterium]